MSKDEMTDEEKPSKKGGMIRKLLLGLALIAVGAGGIFGALQAGIIGGVHEKEDNTPKLIRKGEEDPYASPSKDKEGEGAEVVHGDGGSKFRTAYFSFHDEFTSNLKQSDALVQVSLAASTRRDGRVLMWIGKHELAIRSAVLAVLADTSEEGLYTIEGKERLQKRLTAEINDVLKQQEGFGGVDSVYFRSLIIQ